MLFGVSASLHPYFLPMINGLSFFGRIMYVPTTNSLLRLLTIDTVAANSRIVMDA